MPSKGRVEIIIQNNGSGSNGNRLCGVVIPTDPETFFSTEDRFVSDVGSNSQVTIDFTSPFRNLDVAGAGIA